MYCRCDNNTKQIGINAPLFTDLHKGQFGEMKHDFLEYIRNLEHQKELLVPDHCLTTLTPNGYPMLPNVEFNTLKKVELEVLMHTYLNKHYCMYLSSHMLIYWIVQSLHLVTMSSMYHLWLWKMTHRNLFVQSIFHCCLSSKIQETKRKRKLCPCYATLKSGRSCTMLKKGSGSVCRDYTISNNDSIIKNTCIIVIWSCSHLHKHYRIILRRQISRSNSIISVKPYNNCQCY